jgi:hypothetical protein
MGLNMASIMKKVNAWAKSPAGMARCDKAIQVAIKTNGGVLKSGKKVLSDQMVEDAVNKFIHTLVVSAESHGVPASVLNHLLTADSGKLWYEQTKFGSYQGVVYIYFGGDMSRPSIYPEMYYDEDESGGQHNALHNIVALFNNGYHARDYVYGYWDNHSYKPIGESWNSYRSAHNLLGEGYSAYIRSRKDREGLYFIQQAVDDFNGNYGSMYNATASIEDTIYED